MSAPILPMDMVFEILILLSVETLLRLRSVCKGWRALIDDPNFIEHHLRRSQCSRVRYITRDTIFPHGPCTCCSLDINSVMCDCRGLSLQYCPASKKYSIKNPATRQILGLPDPQKNSFGMAFTYVKSIDEYIVVCLYPNLDGAPGDKCGLLAIGDLAWKQLEMPDLMEPNFIKRQVQTVTSAEAVHFVRLVRTSCLYYAQIDSLDLVTHKFTTVVLPIVLLTDSLDLLPSSADARAKNFHISRVVYPSGFIESRKVKKAEPEPLIQNGTLEAWVTGRTLIWRDTRTRTACGISLVPDENFLDIRVLNSSSLVSLKGMRPDTNKSIAKSSD